MASAAAGLLVAAFFLPTIGSFPEVWAGEGFTHGWIVAGFTAWLVWRHRHALGAGRGHTDAAIFMLLAGLSFVWLVALVTNLRAVHQAVFTVLLTCWVVAVSGKGAARVVVPIGATFLIAVPVWGALVPLLRQVTIFASGSLVHLLGVPAGLEGDVITISSGRFVIEDGCAGLNYLLAGLVTGAVYGHLALRHWPTRVAAVASIAALAIVGNWIRVSTLVVIGHRSQMQSGLMEDHLWLGWVIFGMVLVPFFLLTKRFERADLQRSKVATPAAPTPGVGDESPSHEQSLRGILLPSLAVLLGPILYFTVAALPTDVRSEPSDLSALRLDDGWHVDTTAVERPYTWAPEYVGADGHTAVTLARGEARLTFDRLTFIDQAQGAELIGFSSRISSDETLLDERIVYVGGQGERWVRQAVVRTPEATIVVWYWFRVGGVETVLPAHAKLLEVWAFFRRRPVSTVTALGAPCQADGCEEALRQLLGLMSDQVAEGKQQTGA